jgi:HEPN domain-containing protein
MEPSEKYIYWEEAAKYDLETAKAMLAAGRYVYVVFMCQQAIEKQVKGLHVLYTGDEAKRTHNIWIIFDAIFGKEEYSSLVVDKSFDDKVTEHKPFFADLLYYYISERYPAYKQKVSERVGGVKAKEVLTRTEEVFLWLQSLSQFSKP